MNRHNQYDYMFDTESSTAEIPSSYATTLRFKTLDKTQEYNRWHIFCRYQREADAFYGFIYNYYNDNEADPENQRDSYLDHLYEGLYEGFDEHSCQLQLANPGSDVIYCEECAGASAMEGGRLYCVQYAPLTSTCLLYTSPSPRDRTRSRMPSSA